MTLSKYPPGSLKEVASIALSFILVLFSASLMGLCDRLILAHYSIQALEGAIGALFLIQLFQVPSIRLATIAQVFVGQYKGAGQLRLIGPIVWQMIWFSFFSLIIFIPLSPLLSHIYFQNTAIEAAGGTYYRYLMATCFLFPLGAALSSFYLGQGQTKKVIITSIGSHIVHLLLDFLLIFGVEGWIAPLGVKGAALAFASAQAFFCLVLFWDFLKPHHRLNFGTDQWLLNVPSFWKCLKVGFPRAANKTISLVSWVVITNIMIRKGGNYLVVLAFGGTINLFYTCFNEGMSQALITIGAYLVGAQKPFVAKLIKSSSILLSVGAIILAIPLLIFPNTVITLFYQEMPTEPLLSLLHISCIWLWLLFFTHGFNCIGMGLLTAYGDTLFQMLFGVSFISAATYLPAYFLIERGNASPDLLWLIIAVACLVCAAAYLLRLRQQKWKLMTPFVQTLPRPEAPHSHS